MARVLHRKGGARSNRDAGSSYREATVVMAESGNRGFQYRL